MTEPGRKLIFLVTEDWYFWSHRLPMARAAVASGFDVAVATRVTAHGDAIRAAGLKLYPLRWKRGRNGPLAIIAAIAEIAALYRRERPLIVHHVSLKPAVLGGVAARLAGVKLVVSMMTGMGYLVASRDLSARILGLASRLVLPALLFGRGRRVVVQNEQDRAAITALRPEAAAQIVLIPGSGVDLDYFRPEPEPTPPVTTAYAGRMIGIKGVATLVAAQQRLRARGMELRLILAGDTDPENPSAIAPATLAGWAKLPGIDWRGRCEDIRPVWRAAHIAVLASLGGEGVPKSLLEAAAMGRPIVATDVPGMRTIARHGVNALLVPPGDEDALAEALAQLAQDAGMRRRFGEAGRKLVEQGLNDRAIGAAMQAVYRDLTAEYGAR